MLLALLASGLFIDGGLAYVDKQPTCPQQYNFYKYDQNTVDNPAGILSLGYLWQFKKLSFSLEARHQSMIFVRDYGINQVQATLRWFPFAK